MKSNRLWKTTIPGFIALFLCATSNFSPSLAGDFLPYDTQTSLSGWTPDSPEGPKLPATPFSPAERYIDNSYGDQSGDVHTYCVGSPGTLFQWSYENSFGGGPDLDAPLVTDRPDFTEASSTVGRGVSQLEFGYTYTYNADDGTTDRSQSLGEPLLRYGVFSNWLELRLALFPVDQRVTMAGRSNSTAGTEDLYLGAKIALTPQECFLPEMALIPQMTIPTGSNAFSDGEVLPGVNWIYAWEINDFISTAGSTQINRRVDEGTGRAYSELAQSWTIAYSLSDNLGAYTEWFVLAPNSADTDQTQHYFNGGFTYLINNDVQFDIRYGKGLNHAADDYFVGTGLSIRFK
ncbi:MAG: transporter [Planctomycetaceae bacterium]|nr:transporter [Planctomycetaceae bacterium]MBT6155944.1 transporter [Planctomycetaceae bacterium]MBT6483141.1 transporter [Planctomycetaceae bacterium]MBT6497743.1 transporter [Planctomycetaceae bacterium]